MAIQQRKAYQDFIDFLMSMPAPGQVVKYRISQEEDERISEILHANQNRRLSDAENTELDDYQEIGHLIQWTKIRALQRLQAGQHEEAPIAT